MIVIVGCVMVLGGGAGRIPLGRRPPRRAGPAGRTGRHRRSGPGGAGRHVVEEGDRRPAARHRCSASRARPTARQAYEELFKVLYELFRIARRDGLIALESHLSASPDNSTIFAKYPRFRPQPSRHGFHVRGPVAGVGRDRQARSTDRHLLEADIQLVEEEHHAPLGVLSKTADAMPGFGIVAAVLGIVITMRAIDGPPKEIGEKVGAALVGTFLGILHVPTDSWARCW